MIVFVRIIQTKVDKHHRLHNFYLALVSSCTTNIP